MRRLRMPLKRTSATLLRAEGCSTAVRTEKVDLEFVPSLGCVAILATVQRLYTCLSSAPVLRWLAFDHPALAAQKGVPLPSVKKSRPRIRALAWVRVNSRDHTTSLHMLFRPTLASI
jgi:hypothetical protein